MREQAALSAAPGDLLRQAKRLLDQAQELMDLAAVAERAKGTSWEAIGEAVGGITKSAAQKRFGQQFSEWYGALAPPEVAPRYDGDKEFLFHDAHNKLEEGWRSADQIIQAQDVLSELSNVSAAVSGSSHAQQVNAHVFPWQDPRLIIDGGSAPHRAETLTDFYALGQHARLLDLADPRLSGLIKKTVESSPAPEGFQYPVYYLKTPLVCTVCRPEAHEDKAEESSLGEERTAIGENDRPQAPPTPTVEERLQLLERTVAMLRKTQVEGPARS
ncbi:hypothetical protein [Streptomyces griseorubiginosus]|uniref:hypothetical protein n=1 Tax=Streptomyces griseorubiginosus TaxID=67304 RepID=UPI0036E434E0